MVATAKEALGRQRHPCRRRRHRLPERAGPADGQARRHPRRRRARGPTRSTWSSTAAPSSPADTSTSSTRSPPSRRRAPARTARAPTSRSSWRPASSSPTTTSAAPPGSRCSPAATSSRRAPARSPPPPPFRSPSSCSRPSATGATLTGEQVGVKPAGGIRTTKDAIKYLVTVHETAGEDWLDPAWFRFGASSLLSDLHHAAPEARHRRLLRPRLRHASTDPPRGDESTNMPTFEYAPAPESRAVVDIASSYGLFIGGEFVEGHGEAFKTVNPATEECSPRSPRRPPTTSTPPSRRAHGIHPGLVPDVRRRPRQVPLPDRPDHAGARPRARRPRDPRQRQADQGEPRHRRPPRRGALLLPRRLGRQARVCRARPRPARRSASSDRSSRGTSRSSCSRGRSPPPSPPATPSSSSRPRPRRSPHCSSPTSASRPTCRPASSTSSPAPARPARPSSTTPASTSSPSPAAPRSAR